MSNTSLSGFEMEYISIWGDLYESRGQNRTLGELWGLITLKADSENQALTQLELSEKLHKSVSTVSRQIKTLKLSGIVSETNDNPSKYYTKEDFKVITNLRFKAAVSEYEWTLNELNSILTSIGDKNSEENQILVKKIEIMNKILNKISDIYSSIIVESK